MNDLIANQNLVVILAGIAPFIVSALKNPNWADWAKQALAIVVSLAIGVAAVAVRVEGGGTTWTIDVVLGHVAVVFMIAQAVYHFLLDGSTAPLGAFNARLEALGTKPAPGPGDGA